MLSFTSMCLFPTLRRYAQPFYWYYTSNEGELYRKEKEKITNAAVFEDFHSSKSEKDVVGTFLSFENSKDVKPSQKSVVVTIEHFSQESFSNWLNSRLRIFHAREGQAAERNLDEIHWAAQWKKLYKTADIVIAVIQVTGSSQFCLLQRRTNIHPIDSPKIGFYERIVTFEGPEHYSVLGNLLRNLSKDSVTSPTLASDLQRICNNIAMHIKTINDGKVRISKMVLHFKIDPFERLWLLYTTGLKIVDKTVW